MEVGNLKKGLNSFNSLYAFDYADIMRLLYMLTCILVILRDNPDQLTEGEVWMHNST
jgi:hypothetical protein